MERFQKRILSLIIPNSSYEDSLLTCGIEKLSHRREIARQKLFNKIVNDPNHKLVSLLPPRRYIQYDFRSPCVLEDVTTKTNRFLNTFIPSSVKIFNQSCK